MNTGLLKKFTPIINTLYYTYAHAIRFAYRTLRSFVGNQALIKLHTVNIHGDVNLLNVEFARKNTKCATILDE